MGLARSLQPQRTCRAVDSGPWHLLNWPSKKDTKSIIGVAGTRLILERLSGVTEGSRSVAAVAIGGINASNIQRVLFQSKSNSKSLDGVAVVSCIVATENPKLCAKELRYLMQRPPPFYIANENGRSARDVDTILRTTHDIVRRVGEIGPLSHNMINQVVVNFAANVALAMWVIQVLEKSSC